MRCAVIIPARYASTRLPGKPLLRQTGKYLVQHVYEQALLCRRASAVLVATDDSRIFAAVESFGGRAVLTRPDHPSGTDRVAEVARGLDADVIINLQGDEPLIDPAALDMLPALLERDPDADMATLATPIAFAEHWHNPNCVKVVCDATGLGLYAYRRAFLFSLASLPPEPLEQLEKLEQLRVLALGRRIQVGVVRNASVGVDTYADYERFVQLYRQRGPARAA